MIISTSILMIVQPPHIDLLTLLIQAKGRLDTLPRSNDSSVQSCCRCSIDEFSPISQGSNSPKKGEEDEEEQKGLSFSQWNAGFDIKLGKCALSCESFAQNGCLCKSKPGVKS
jgi:hypothetical protein